MPQTGKQYRRKDIHEGTRRTTKDHEENLKENPASPSFSPSGKGSPRPQMLGIAGTTSSASSFMERRHLSRSSQSLEVISRVPNPPVTSQTSSN